MEPAKKSLCYPRPESINSEQSGRGLPAKNGRDFAIQSPLDTEARPFIPSFSSTLPSSFLLVGSFTSVPASSLPLTPMCGGSDGWRRKKEALPSPSFLPFLPPWPEFLQTCCGGLRMRLREGPHQLRERRGKEGNIELEVRPVYAMAVSVPPSSFHPLR